MEYEPTPSEIEAVGRPNPSSRGESLGRSSSSGPVDHPNAEELPQAQSTYQRLPDHPMYQQVCRRLEQKRLDDEFWEQWSEDQLWEVFNGVDDFAQVEPTLVSHSAAEPPSSSGQISEGQESAAPDPDRVRHFARIGGRTPPSPSWRMTPPEAKSVVTTPPSQVWRQRSPGHEDLGLTERCTDSGEYTVRDGSAVSDHNFQSLPEGVTSSVLDRAGPSFSEVFQGIQQVSTDTPRWIESTVGIPKILLGAPGLPLPPPMEVLRGMPSSGSDFQPRSLTREELRQVYPAIDWREDSTFRIWFRMPDNKCGRNIGLHKLALAEIERGTVEKGTEETFIQKQVTRWEKDFHILIRTNMMLAG